MLMVLNQSVRVVMRVATEHARVSDRDSLFNEEEHIGGGDVASRIIDVDDSFGGLVGNIDVLLEFGLHLGVTLTNAAPGGDLGGFFLGRVSHEVDGLLADGKHLLVLHVIFVVLCVDLNLDRVLDLCLRLGAVVLILEVHRGGNLFRKVQLEGNLVVARFEMGIVSEVEDLLFVFEEVLAHLVSLVTFVSVISLSFVPEASECGILLSLELKLDVLGLEGVVNLNVDLTVDGLSGLVEGELGLEHALATFEVGTTVAEKPLNHIFRPH